MLRALERKYPEEISVVGVHTAKIDQERVTENIRQSILRYGVSHPVINDANKSVWDAYTVHSWPTLMFVDPLGKVIGRFEGELAYDQAVTLIEEMLAEFKTAGTLKPSPGIGQLERAERSVLSYPGKVLADVENDRLFISDSGHHRVLVTDLDGAIRFVDATRIPYQAPSLGGVESLIELPVTMSFWDYPKEERLKLGITDSLVRFACGIEDPNDLIADLEQALENV